MVLSEFLGPLLEEGIRGQHCAAIGRLDCPSLLLNSSLREADSWTSASTRTRRRNLEARAS